MKEYQVTLSCTDFITVVTAKNKDDAREKAIKDYEQSEDKPSVMVMDIEEVE